MHRSPLVVADRLRWPSFHRQRQRPVRCIRRGDGKPHLGISEAARGRADLAIRRDPSSAGVASTASIAMADNKRAVVVFVRPDQSIGAHLGSGRLFALDPVRAPKYGSRRKLQSSMD